MPRAKSIIFTQEEEEWFAKHFPYIPDAELAKRFGCSVSAIQTKARYRGLHKDKYHISKMCSESNKALHARLTAEGRVIPSLFKAGESCKDRYGEEAEKRRVEKSAEGCKRRRQLELTRIRAGLPQETKMHIRHRPNSYYWQRGHLVRRGYILVDDHTMYYDENTHRCPRIEDGTYKTAFRFYPKPKDDEQTI